MTTFLTIIHVLVCFFLVAVVLLQSGRAGGMGVFSGAATQTVFGGRGAGGFLAKATTICATLFMITSASLAYLSTSGRDSLARSTHRHGGAASTAPARNSSTRTPSTPAHPVPAHAPSGRDAGTGSAH